jgi:hypothetical protein
MGRTENGDESQERVSPIAWLANRATAADIGCLARPFHNPGVPYGLSYQALAAVLLARTIDWPVF